MFQVTLSTDIIDASNSPLSTSDFVGFSSWINQKCLSICDWLHLGLYARARVVCVCVCARARVRERESSIRSTSSHLPIEISFKHYSLHHTLPMQIHYASSSSKNKKNRSYDDTSLWNYSSSYLLNYFLFKNILRWYLIYIYFKIYFWHQHIKII